MVRTSPKQLIQGETILTKRQLAFIDALISNGGKLEQAGITAGYSTNTARHSAYSNLRLPHVLAEYRARLTQRLAGAAAGSLNTISRLAESAKSEPVQLAAAKDILDRFSLTVKEQHQIGGITINIGMKGDPCATKTIDGTAQHIDDQGMITAGIGDSASPDVD